MLKLINFIFNHNKKKFFLKRGSKTLCSQFYCAAVLVAGYRAQTQAPNSPGLSLALASQKAPKTPYQWWHAPPPFPSYGQGSWLLSPWPSLTYLTPHSPTCQTLPWALRVSSEHHPEKTIFVRDQALKYKGNTSKAKCYGDKGARTEEAVGRGSWGGLSGQEVDIWVLIQNDRAHASASTLERAQRALKCTVSSVHWNQ